MSTGVRGSNWVASFAGGRISVQLTFEDTDSDINTLRFEDLFTRRVEFEEAFGAPIEWEPREGLKSTRIAIYSPEQCDVSNSNKWAEWVDWLIDNSIRLRAAVATVGGVPLPNGIID